MKNLFRCLILFLLVFVMLVPSLIQAAPEIIGISNLTTGEPKAGPFEVKGVVLNDGQITRVAVKAGIGPWENAIGVNCFSYKIDPRQIVLSYDGNGSPVKGSFYGDLNITVATFNANGDKINEKTVTITIIPEKPYSDLISGVYCEPLNVILKAASDLSIYYTVDGTDPKTSGIKYSNAIYVSQNTVIKAVTKSSANQYSETAIFDLKIDNTSSPHFQVQYYEDQALSRPVPDPVYLKAGTYYLKIVSDRRFSNGPFLNIDMPGYNNDIPHCLVDTVSDCVFRYTRVVKTDSVTIGNIRETMTIDGADINWNSIQSIVPLNCATKAAYLDTQPPAQGNLAIAGGISTTNDPTPKLAINSTGAAYMRLALSESGLASAPWVDYAAQYDEFDISSGGNGNKTLWIEFKDNAGNIQIAHAYTTVNYDNTFVSYDIEYFSDSGLTHSLGNNPYLKAGTYFLKITANQNLTGNPTIQIDAEGSNNDVSSVSTIINPRIFYYTRIITADDAAIGTVKEQITINGMNPSNVDCKAAFTDTLPPGTPIVNGTANAETFKPTWSWNKINDADYYRYSFTGDSDWTETTATSFTPVENLKVGTYTLYVQAGDRSGNWSSSGSFTTTIIASPKINIKQGITTLQNGTGVFDFGNVSLLSTGTATFTIESIGTTDLILNGNSYVQISGSDAASFRVMAAPPLPIAPNGSTTFEIMFTPTSTGTKTAMISISSNDTDATPYTFTVTGTGTGVVEPLTPDTWTSGVIAAVGEKKLYSINITPGKIYAINWDDSYQGSGTYTGDVKVSVYKQDLTTSYFEDYDSGYTTPRTITPQENTVYLKVEAYSTTGTGSFGLKVSEVPSKPVINVKQGTTSIINGTGNYNLGNVSLGSTSDTTFTIENNGGDYLNLTGNPKVQISGADASCFQVRTQPSSSIASFGKTTFVVRFIPNNPGAKTATINVANDDSNNNPYTFTLTGTGTGSVQSLTLDTWTTGNISTSSEAKIYSFATTPGKTYQIAWDDCYQGSGTYTGDIYVTAYCQDFYTTYFNNLNSGYTTPPNITPQENIVYIKVSVLSTGNFALKAYEITPQPALTLTANSTNILNGGSFDFGNSALCSGKSVSFTIQNTGTGSLELTNTPKIQITGPDATDFGVSIQPSSPIASNQSTFCYIYFDPKSTGAKTATVSIVNNSDTSPYIFTITGTGIIDETLNPGIWTTGNIATKGASKTYSFNVTPGNSYTISWDDLKEGSGNYTDDIKVSAYRQNTTTSYFSYVNSGYLTPQTFVAQDSVVYIKVESYSYDSLGTYALKASVFEPVVNVKQGTTVTPNGGSYNFGNIALCSSNSAVFTLQNTGGNLNLTNTPKIQISGTDASCFSLTTDASSPVAPNNSTSFTVKFTPTDTGTKTATVSIAYNGTNSPYTFTITGTSVIEGTLTPGIWTTGNISNPGDVKTYCFNTTPGVSYAIVWDDSHSSSYTYTCDVKVSAYRQDGINSYFTDIDSGYLSPQVITAQDNLVYIKVMGDYSSAIGSFALKAFVSGPAMLIKQNSTTIIPNGSGNYNCGNVAVCSYRYAYFTIYNTGGTSDLNLTDTPIVRITGADAASFKLDGAPSTPISPNSSSNFTIKFVPTSSGTKTATVSIASNDGYNDPYTFTITGTGTTETITPEAWTPGNVTTGGEKKTYCFSAVVGNDYAITWDDSFEGSGKYSGDIYVSAYRQDGATSYFYSTNSGYKTPKIIKAQDNIVYIVVESYFSNTTGSFALKVATVKPVLNVKNGSTDIPSGTGNHDLGNVSIGSINYATFTIQNTGVVNLNLTGSSKVVISGADASSFSVTSQPVSPVTPNSSTTFKVKFIPTSVGLKTATVSISNDDTANNPYTFTISGTGIILPLTLDSWNTGSISYGGEEKNYSFNTTPGKTYTINWDDSVQGSGSFQGDVKVSAFHQDFSTRYFSDIDSGYSIPRIITAQENIVYLKVVGINSSATGSFALKVCEIIPEPIMNVCQGTTNIPYGTSYSFGSIALFSNSTVTFTVQNNGTGNLNLTDSPKIRISGADASCFSVTADAVSPVAPFSSTTFSVKFTPNGPGTKTAMLSIATNDADNSPYVMNVTGEGTVESFNLDSWVTGNSTTSDEIKTYFFNTTPGKSYMILWDDVFDGSRTYTGDILVSAYNQDLTTTYFSQISNGYTSLNFITAQGNIAYLKIQTRYTGSYAFKVYEFVPKAIIDVKQGTNDIPNGTGSYNFGKMQLFTSSNDVTFTIQNTGNINLDLSNVTVTGMHVSSFNITGLPSSTLAPNSSTTFTVKFTPASMGGKTATINVVSNNADNKPYSFTVTGTGAAEGLALDTWTPGTITTDSSVKAYYFYASRHKNYAIAWDESGGSGFYNASIMVSAYQQDRITPYFSDINSGYTDPRYLQAQDDIVYIKVTSYNPVYNSNFALKVYEVAPKPEITIKDATGSIIILPNGSGSWDFGDVKLNTSKTVHFLIKNTGNADLYLYHNPIVSIYSSNGNFTVTSQPDRDVIKPYEVTGFSVTFTPTSAEAMSASISIDSNSNNVNGTTSSSVMLYGKGTTTTSPPSGTLLSLNSWTSGSITAAGATKKYYFNAVPGKTYKIYWDDSYQGSGSYSCDVKVSAYKQDNITTYFSNADSAYTTPRTITAQDNIVYLEVAGYYSSSTGSFALKVVQN
jgi:hypothetical protein